MKKLNLNYTNYIDNEDVMENINECITEYDLICRDWTYALIRKHLGEPHFTFTDNKFDKGKITNLYFAPRVFMIEESEEFIKSYTQFGIKDKLIKLGHDIECDYNSGKCKNCEFKIGWTRRKVQYFHPAIDYESMTCNEMIIKKLLE